MKRIIALLAAASVLLTSCGNAGRDAESGNNPEREHLTAQGEGMYVGKEVTDTTKQRVGALIQKVEKHGMAVSVFEHGIHTTINGEESSVFQTYRDEDTEPDASIHIKDGQKVRFSPDGQIVIFEWYIAKDRCITSGVDLNRKKLIWDTGIGCDAKEYWSPDGQQVAFVGNFADTLFISVSQYGNIENLVNTVKVAYPQAATGTEYSWKDDSTFVFKPDPQYSNQIKDAFEQANINTGKNEFKTR